MEEDGPINIFAALKGLFTMLTVREPPFEDALDWLQLAYTDYVGPASTILPQSVITKGDELFPACLKHLRRLYPEVYGPGVQPLEVSLGQAP